MTVGAFAIAAIGFFFGLFFRMKALLPVVGLLLAASVIHSVTSQSTFLAAALFALCAQIILQASYVTGVVLRGLLTRSGGGSPVF